MHVQIIRSSDVSHCVLEGILDVKGVTTSDSCYVETGGPTTHGRWSYGSATVTGMYLKLFKCHGLGKK